MTEQRRRPATAMAVVGTVLILMGLGCWALYVKASGDAPHAFARAGAPPQFVRVEIGKVYRIAVRGGSDTLRSAGIDPGSLVCTAAGPGEAPGALNLTPEGKSREDTGGPLNDIASFTSAIDGRLHVECNGLGPVYVDNAEDSPTDWSGVWLVLTSISLLIGVPLILSVLRQAGARPGDERPERPDDSVPADVGGVDPAAEEVL